MLSLSYADMCFSESLRRRSHSLRLRRGAHLRILSAVTTALQHPGLTPNLKTDYFTDPPPSLTADEARLLEENDIEKYVNCLC